MVQASGTHQKNKKMEEQFSDNGKIRKISLMSNLQVWLAANPVLHNPIALALLWTIDCINFLLLYIVIDTKTLRVIHYFFFAILAGIVVVCSWLTIVLIQACKYEFRMFLLQKKTDLDDVIHNYQNRPDELRNAAARHLKDRVYRTFSLFKGSGGGASPIENATTDSPSVVVEEVKQEGIQIELIKDDKEFNYKIEGEQGIISWKQIAKWYSEAYAAYKKNNTPAAKERLREKSRMYLLARNLKNDEITRRFVEKLSIRTYDDKVRLYFKSVPQGSDDNVCYPHRLTGTLTRCRQYMAMYIKCIESKLQLPDPNAYGVEHEEKIEWTFFNEGTSTTAGCIYKIEIA